MERYVYLLLLLILLRPSAAAGNDLAGNADIWDGVGQNPSDCTYKCSNCTSEFYTQHENGSCARPKSPPPDWFMFGGSCVSQNLVQDSAIRDAASCYSIKAGTRTDVLGFLGFFGVYDVQFSELTGCQVIARNFKAIGLEELRSPVCFGTFSKVLGGLFQFVFAVSGVVAGIVNVKCTPDVKCMYNSIQDAGQETFFELLPGCKLVARNTCLRRGQGAYVKFYRSMEVVAQFWVPAVLLWVYSPFIVFIGCFVLYLLPGFCHAGFGLVGDPRIFVTPGNCGLLGLRSCYSKNRIAALRLFFLCRPLAFCGLTLAITELVIFFARMQGMSIETITQLSVMDKNIYALAFQNYWGDVLFVVVFWVTVVGTVFYILLSIKPLLKLMANRDPENDWIDFDKNEEQAAKFEAMTLAICNAACADNVDDQDRVHAFNISTYTKRSTIFSFLLVVVDVLGYFYKVYALMSRANYFVAGCMTFFLFTLFTTLLLEGHLKFVKQAFVRTITTGIPSRRFLGITQCDALTGILSLALSVYGLPLTRPAHPVYAFINFFFLLTGTKAVADFLFDIEDAGMYEIRETKIIDSFSAMMLCSGEETSETDDTSDSDLL